MSGLSTVGIAMGRAVFSRRAKRTLMIGLVIVSVTCSRAWAVPRHVVLGPQQVFPDQPYVTVELFAPDGSNPGEWTSLGPEGGGIFGFFGYNSFLLDTGANGILAVDAAAQSLESSSGYVTEAEFFEIGVAGATIYDVSAPYRFTFTGTDGVAIELPMTSDGVRIQSSSLAQLGGPVDWFGIAGLVGMPAMVNRVTKLDFSAWSNVHDILDFTPMGVTFSDDLPAGNGHRYSVPVDNRISFAAADGRPDWEDPDSPLPTYADVPFMTAVAGHHDADGRPVDRSGSFLLDTGAQFTVLSRSMAFRLGMDANGDGDLEDDAIDFVEIAGVGGTRRVPIMLLDEFRLPTQEGAELIWKPTDPDDLGLQMIVLDIFPCGDVNGDGIVTDADAQVVQSNWGQSVPAGDLPSGDATGDGLINQDDLDLIQSQLGQDTFVDGVFGADLLTAGVALNWDTWELEGDPFFQQVYFDFRDMDEGTGMVYLDLTPAYDVPDLLGDANGDGVVNAEDASILGAHWLQTVSGGFADGDFNTDGVVDDRDAAILAAHWNTGVIEPTPGDANNDGVVDDADASILGAHWLASVYGGFADGDFNTDGVVDDRDAAILAAHWTASVIEPMPGDANDDGVVDAEDASILGAHWLDEVSGGFADGDFNIDGVVDDRDAAILAAHWTTSAENPAVPEPATLTLLVAGLAMLAARKLLRAKAFLECGDSSPLLRSICGQKDCAG